MLSSRRHSDRTHLISGSVVGRIFSCFSVVDRKKKEDEKLLFYFEHMVNRSQQSIVRICTFNIRLDEIDIGTPNEWKKRRPIVKKCLENMQPLIIATQEGDPHELKDVLEDLNE